MECSGHPAVGFHSHVVVFVHAAGLCVCMCIFRVFFCGEGAKLELRVQDSTAVAAGWLPRTVVGKQLQEVALCRQCGGGGSVGGLDC